MRKSVASVAIAATMLFAAAAPARLVTLTIPAPDGAIPQTWLNYPGSPRANVRLPAGYDPHKRYPLLVLLHGLGGNYAWFEQTQLLKEFDSLDAIVVMPEGGPGGWYADWWNDGRRGSPSWESYELDQVLPAILSRYKIRPERRFHAIAGISMGGLGASYLGGRLPGFFGTVASLSGFVDPQFLGFFIQPAMALVSDAWIKANEFDPVYGSSDGFYADGHNPADLATNLKQTRVYETTGTGIPSSAGLALIAQGASEELVNGLWEESAVIDPMSTLYHDALTAAHVDVTYQVHSGGHDLPAFIDEIKALLAWGLFKPVTTKPTSWENETVAGHGQLWDIGYRFANPPTSVVRFSRSGSALSISDAGSAVTITTSAAASCTPRRPRRSNCRTVAAPGRDVTYA